MPNERGDDAPEGFISECSFERWWSFYLPRNLLCQLSLITSPYAAFTLLLLFFHAFLLWCDDDQRLNLIYEIRRSSTKCNVHSVVNNAGYVDHSPWLSRHCSVCCVTPRHLRGIIYTDTSMINIGCWRPDISKTTHSCRISACVNNVGVTEWTMHSLVSQT